MELDSYFYELFENLPRQGLGDNESTRRALAMMGELPAAVRLLDIGCGSGMQTIELAKNVGGTIVALDNHRPFLDQLREKAEREGLSGRIETVCGSMDSMEFEKHSFDLIWTEGAIFVIGFERGLREFKTFLGPRGSMAVSELCWIKDDPPEEIRAFFGAVYPDMKPVAERIDQVKKAGFEPLGSFTIPESASWDNYYRPLEDRMEGMRLKYPGNARVDELCLDTEREIDMYRRYADWYGNCFFVMRSED